MSTGDPFYYFSSQGAYNLASQNTVNAQNAANVANIYGSSTTNTITGTLGLIGGVTYGGLSANQWVQQPVETLRESLERVAKPAKKIAKGVLAKLQAEIDDWHGDILERCPA